MLVTTSPWAISMCVYVDLYYSDWYFPVIFFKSSSYDDCSYFKYLFVYK